MDFKKSFIEYEKNGFTIIENFLNSSEVECLLQESKNIVQNMILPKHCSVFSTATNQERDEYFLNSGDKISYFFEKDAVDKEGNLCVAREKSLNKVGHALHWWNSCFKNITFHDKVKALLKVFQYENPVLVQSMIIFKHPSIGGKVNPHQDSTFLFTEPLSTIGFWFPLVDVNNENGCLWFLPGSHKYPIYQRFVRNKNDGPLLLLEGEIKEYEDASYIPALVNKGDCVVIHGSVIHKSGINLSHESRPVYTFHAVEQANTQYSKCNWLQPSEMLPFPSIYSN